MGKILSLTVQSAAILSQIRLAGCELDESAPISPVSRAAPDNNGLLHRYFTPPGKILSLTVQNAAILSQIRLAGSERAKSAPISPVSRAAPDNNGLLHR